MKQPPVTLTSHQRAIVEAAIRETCTTRKWQLWTVNVRTNHVHSVISADKKPEAILGALKANATRAMGQAGAWTGGTSPWAHGGSKKYLWDDKELANGIAYVDGVQGEPLD